MPPAPTQTPGTRQTHSRRSALTSLQSSPPTSNHQLAALPFLGGFSIPAVMGFARGPAHRRKAWAQETHCVCTSPGLELAESDPEF